MSVLLLSVVVGVAVLASLFVARYWRLRWERSAAGRSVMATAVAVSVLAWAAVARRVDELLPHENFTTKVNAALLLAWLLMGGTFLWQHRELSRSQQRRH